jgi:hypothetical protein
MKLNTSFGLQFLHHVNNDSINYNDVFPISKNTTKAMAQKYFLDYCSSENEINGLFWELLNSCRYSEWKTDSTIKNQLPDEIKLVSRNFIKSKDLDGFLFAMISCDPLNKSGFGLISNFIESFFGPKEDFESLIIDVNGSGKREYLEEFKMFYERYKEKGFSGYIDFPFKIIPIEKKIDS